VRILVLGGGIVGVTTAYELARDGHEVELVDRQPLAANETSFSNSGMIAPGHAYTWNSPRAPRILLRSLWRNDTALRFKFRADPRLYAWSLRFLRACTSDAAIAKTRIKLRLCLYSKDRLKATLEDVDLPHDRATKGALYLFRDPAHFERGVANSRILVDGGVKLEVCDLRRIAEIEPRLVRDGIHGAIYSPGDESGDCHVFANALARHCAERLGVKLRWDTRIERLVADGDRIASVVTDKGTLTADAVVLALGSDAPIIARGVGLSIPVYPVKGYAVTFDIAGRNGAPQTPGVDETYLAAWLRIGDRLRFCATAEFAGYDTSHRPADFAHMMKVGRSLFPDGADYSTGRMWAGLRPMTPKGPPILGRSRHRNLWLNCGQGHMGWTMSHGSARIVADLIAGRAPAIDIAGMTLADA